MTSETLTVAERVGRLERAVGARGLVAHGLDDVEAALGGLGVYSDPRASVAARIGAAEAGLVALGADLAEFDSDPVKARRREHAERELAAARKAEAAERFRRAEAAAAAEAEAEAAARRQAEQVDRDRREREAAELEAEAGRLAEAATVMQGRAKAARAELKRAGR